MIKIITNIFKYLLMLTLFSSQSNVSDFLLRLQAEEQERVHVAQQQARNVFARFLLGQSINDQEVEIARRNSIIILEESFKYLESYPGVKSKLVQSAKTSFLYFSLTRSPSDVMDRAGSYHRARQSLFMDFGNLPKNDWFVILIHELAHGVDDVMRNALVEFGSRSTRTQILEILERKKSSAQLNLQERDLIRTWLTAGLERGLLAEYRAWLLTYLAYQEGLRDGTLQPTEWLERLHNTKPADSNIETHIYRTLHQSWQDPSDDIFAHPVISELLRELRQELYDNPNLIRMGNIGKLITG